MTKKEMEQELATLIRRLDALTNSIYMKGAWDYKTGRANVKNADDVTVQELASYVLDGTPIVRNAKQIVYGEERKSEEV